MCWFASRCTLTHTCSYMYLFSIYTYIYIYIPIVEHCLQLQGEWHGLRRDMEDLLQSKDTLAKELSSMSQTGTYKPDVFRGHCTQRGSQGYLMMDMDLATAKRIPEFLWGESVK